MRARTSMAAASAPDPKNHNEWIFGWCSSGRIWCWRSSKYSMGLSTIFLYHFSRSLWAISLVPKLSSLCFEDLWLGLWPDLWSCLPDLRSEWPEPLTTAPERGLLWASARCRELSRCGRSSLVESSYLLRAAGPRPSKSSGFGTFRRTDFTMDFNFSIDAGASGSLAGWERALSDCWPPTLEISQEGLAPLDRPRFGSASPHGWELLLLFFSSGGHSKRVAALPRAGWSEYDSFRTSGGGRVDSNKWVGQWILGRFPFRLPPRLFRGWCRLSPGCGQSFLETLAEGGPRRLRRSQGHYPVGRPLQYVLD